MNNTDNATDPAPAFLTQTSLVHIGDVFQQPTLTDLLFVTTNTEEYNYSSTDATPPRTTSGELSLQCVVFVMGVVGSVCNALVITILVCPKKTSSHVKSFTNVLILNQLSIDMYSCVFLVVTYAYKLRNSYLDDDSTSDVILCLLLDSEMLLGIGLNSSPASLFFIAAERYAKIVHPILHREYFRPWMSYVSVAIAWLNGILLTAPVTVVTTTLVDGRCQALLAWPNASQQIAFGIFNFLWDYLIPSMIFLYCYWHIAIVIRGRVKGGPITGITSRQIDSHIVVHPSIIINQSVVTSRSQIAGIKTIVIITSLFIVCWLPNQIYFLLMNLGKDGLSPLSHCWYGTTAFAFIIISVQPFIYTGKLIKRSSAVRHSVA